MIFLYCYVLLVYKALPGSPAGPLLALNSHNRLGRRHGSQAQDGPSAPGVCFAGCGRPRGPHPRGTTQWAVSWWLRSAPSTPPTVVSSFALLSSPSLLLISSLETSSCLQFTFGNPRKRGHQKRGRHTACAMATGQLRALF